MITIGISTIFLNCQGKDTINKIVIADTIIIENKQIKVGAEQTELYFPILKNKKIGILSNQTSIIAHQHIVDTLVNAGFEIECIFAPEHGFRGHAEAGEKVSGSIDSKTGIKVISLYGKNFKPAKKDIENIDIMIFDIQDVGARFYTYISTLHYLMEACADAEIPLLILDRPNPNGFYIDGPILNLDFQSFIGMHTIPIIHGMTIGEIAQMINGEKWLANKQECKLTIIPIANYTHTDLYELPIAPSPNLQSMQSIYLYPSLCLFEGTIISVGRGTDNPFEIFGHPLYTNHTFSFTPESRPGFAAKPPYMGEKCFGLNLVEYVDTLLANPKLELKWLIDAYQALKDKANFFNNNMFDKLTGSSILRQQIISGMSEDKIRDSWKNELNNFKIIRKQYLLYDDFE